MFYSYSCIHSSYVNYVNYVYANIMFQPFAEHVAGKNHRKKEALNGQMSAPSGGGSVGNSSVRGAASLLSNGYCELCGVSCSSAGTFAAHIAGAKHLKVCYPSSLTLTIFLTLSLALTFHLKYWGDAPLGIPKCQICKKYYKQVSILVRKVFGFQIRFQICTTL